MQHRFAHTARACAAFVLTAMLSACGGGGGGAGSTPPLLASSPPVSQVPAAGTVLVPGKQSSGGGGGGFVNDGNALSTYAVTSNPSGQTFTLAGQTYTTPATVTPPVAGAAGLTGALAITFSSGYSVPVTQVKDGPHTVFYNATADSTGTIAVSTLQGIARRSASATTRRTGAGLAHRAYGRARVPAADVDPTRVAVRFKAAALSSSGRSPADVERAVGSVGRDTASATTDRLRIVTVPAGANRDQFVRTLSAQAEVAEVTPVHIRHLLTRTPTAVSDPYAEIPDQWYTAASGTNYAWSYNPGSGAKIAIIDTGIDEANTDLTSQLAFQETAVTPIDNAMPGASCSAQPNATTLVTPNAAPDDNGHGTNVAGLALAASNGTGFAGAAWGAQLIAIKVFANQNANCGSALIGANTADEAQAIADAVAQGADVISLSLGSATFDATEFNAVESAIAAGVTVVAASGNSENGEPAGTLDYPGAYPGVISVGASALKDENYTTQNAQTTGTYSTSTEIVASYSQSGATLSVVAPGGDPQSTPNCGNTCDNDFLHWIENYSTSVQSPFDQSFQCSTRVPATSCRALFAGTSMATPQVSATAAMLIAEAGGHNHLTPAAVKYAIESTADNINDPKQGHGRLNAYRALASLIRDTAAYSGPIVQTAGTANLVAFAYRTGNTNRPAIVDATFPAGVPVSSNGTFRIADVPVGTGSFGVAVWYDTNGDGAVDAGDQIGTASAKCSASTVCQIGTITMQTVGAGYYLP